MRFCLERNRENLGRPKDMSIARFLRVRVTHPCFIFLHFWTAVIWNTLFRSLLNIQNILFLTWYSSLTALWEWAHLHDKNVLKETSNFIVFSISPLPQMPIDCCWKAMRQMQTATMPLQASLLPDVNGKTYDQRIHISWVPLILSDIKHSLFVPFVWKANWAMRRLDKGDIDAVHPF